MARRKSSTRRRGHRGRNGLRSGRVRAACFEPAPRLLAGTSAERRTACLPGWAACRDGMPMPGEGVSASFDARGTSDTGVAHARSIPAETHEGPHKAGLRRQTYGDGLNRRAWSPDRDRARRRPDPARARARARAAGRRPCRVAASPHSPAPRPLDGVLGGVVLVSVMSASQFENDIEVRTQRGFPG